MDIHFDLCFDGPLSAEYAKMLQDYIDGLIETGLNEQHRYIYITFEGQTDESYDILYNYYYGGEL